MFRALSLSSGVERTSPRCLSWLSSEACSCSGSSFQCRRGLMSRDASVQVLGMASNRGIQLGSKEEEEEADQLRLAVADALCRSSTRRTQYEEALISISVDESISRYCTRITSPTFWGGESELLVLSRMCAQPITVYIPEAAAKQGARTWGTGFIPIVEYGTEFTKATKERKGRKPVRLLFNGKNHYDLLI
eukprot:SM000078S22045  [mRNA]  locus=s78:62111:63511:- [translate_table: standard]